MPQSRTITYICSKCGHKNKVLVPPHIGGWGSQIQAKNMPAEPRIFHKKCSNCDFVNSIKVK